jgi:hypothetical protein
MSSQATRCVAVAAGAPDARALGLTCRCQSPLTWDVHEAAASVRDEEGGGRRPSGRARRARRGGPARDTEALRRRMLRARDRRNEASRFGSYFCFGNAAAARGRTLRANTTWLLPPAPLLLLLACCFLLWIYAAAPLLSSLCCVQLSGTW